MIADDGIEAAVDRLSELLDLQIGLRPETTLRGRLRRCLRDEVSVRGGDLDAYLRALAGSDHLLQSLVNRVTVQESAFFRHPDHFEVLANDILPGLDPPVTIWSAGCANGQEAYSLAMVLEEQGVQGSVVATDLSTTALARTTAARYSSREIAALSASRIARHLTRDGDAWEVKRSLRSRVTTLRHNLITDLPGHVGVCQVVFCRNVLIYFSPEHAKAFLDRLAGALAPGAFLILGSAESLWQVTDRFSLSSAFSILDAKSTQNYCGTTYEQGPNEGEIVTDCDDPLAPDVTFLQAPAGQELPVQAEFKANAVGRYNFAMGGLDSHLQVAWVYSGSAWSDLRTDERELLGKQPSYDLVDFAWGVKKDDWGLELFVKNVFDERAVLSRFTECSEFKPWDPEEEDEPNEVVLCGAQPYTVTTAPRTIGLTFSKSF